MKDPGLERFTALYQTHYHRILGYARRRADAASSDDVVAETFAIAWRRLDDVPRGAELLWLYGVARRVLANQRRAGARRDRLARTLREEQPPLSAGPQDSGVADAFVRLTTADRELLSLVGWEGLSPKEVAAVIGVSANAARIRIHRAKRRFEHELAVAGVSRQRHRIAIELEDHQ